MVSIQIGWWIGWKFVCIQSFTSLKFICICLFSQLRLITRFSENLVLSGGVKINCLNFFRKFLKKHHWWSPELEWYYYWWVDLCCYWNCSPQHVVLWSYFCELQALKIQVMSGHFSYFSKLTDYFIDEY